MEKDPQAYALKDLLRVVLVSEILMLEAFIGE